jgi:microcompartment protein CcmK/EutM
VEGRSASQAVNLPKAPIDAAIVGIVDRIDPV